MQQSGNNAGARTHASPSYLCVLDLSFSVSVSSSRLMRASGPQSRPRTQTERRVGQGAGDKRREKKSFSPKSAGLRSKTVEIVAVSINLNPSGDLRPVHHHQPLAVEPVIVLQAESSRVTGSHGREEPGGSGSCNRHHRSVGDL